MSKGFVDYYSILEINPTNDIKTIKKAYKRLAKLTHPDVNGTGDDTQFKKIQNAYDLLKSEEILNKYYNYYKKQQEKSKKEIYDEFRKKYEEYVVNKPVQYEKKHTKNEENGKNKKNKLNVFFENFKKDKYVLKTATVLGMLTTVMIVLHMTNIKKQNDDINNVPVQDIQYEVNEDNLNYELIRNYEIKKGDTLYDLARSIGTSVDRIKEINNLKDDTIYYNDTIKLPYEVQKEDLKYYTISTNVEDSSIYNLAEQYNTTTETIYNLNRESIIIKNGNYYVLSNSLKMPKFITENEKNSLKNSEKDKILSK